MFMSESVAIEALNASVLSLLWGAGRGARVAGAQRLRLRPVLAAASSKVRAVRCASLHASSLFRVAAVGPRKAGARSASVFGQAQSQPPSCLHRRGQQRPGAPAWLALATAASVNKLVHRTAYGGR